LASKLTGSCATQARESTVHALSSSNLRTQSGEVLRRWRRAREEGVGSEDQSPESYEELLAIHDMDLAAQQRRVNVVACGLVQRHKGTSQEGVMNFHLCSCRLNIS